MPSLRFAGRQWHLASDMLPGLSLVLGTISLAFLLALISVHFATENPNTCTPSEVHAHNAVVYGNMVLLGWNVLTATLIIWIGMQGTPFTPSRRKAMGTVLYIQGVKWILTIGFLIFSLCWVYRVGSSCNSPTRLRALRAVLFSYFGILALILLVLIGGYNPFSALEPKQRWRARITVLARLLNCYDVISDTNIMPDGSNDAPLEELAGLFSRFFGTVELEKSDFLAGLVLVGLLQGYQRRDKIEDALQRRDAKPMCREMNAPGSQKNPVGSLEAAESQKPLEQCWKDTNHFVDVYRDLYALPDEGSEPQQKEFLGEDVSNHCKPHLPSRDLPDPLTDTEGPFRQWVTSIVQGPSPYITPSHWAAAIAPGVSTCALVGGHPRRAKGEEVAEAAHWARYAIAAYGSSAYIWTTTKTAWCCSGSYWRNRARLAVKTRPRRTVLKAALPPVREKLAHDARSLRDYVGTKKVLHIPDSDFVYCNFTDAALGTTPYNIVLDRERKTVVVAIRGSSSVQDFVTDMMDRPVDVGDWVPDIVHREHPDLGEVRVHAGMYSCARAILRDLDQHRLLSTLLHGAPPCRAERQAQRGRFDPDARDASFYHALQHLREEWRDDKGVDRANTSLPVVLGQRLDEWAAAVHKPDFLLGSQRRAPGESLAMQEMTKNNNKIDGERSALVERQLRRLRQKLKHRRAPLEQILDAEDYEVLIASRGIDCRGWRLVVTGHSLGAAVAVLVGLHLQSLSPSIRVFAFSPPGGMATPNLFPLLEPFVTNVVIGKDVIPRLGTVTFERFIDQMVVALAACRLSKMRVLMRSRSAALRTLPRGRVFFDADHIPREAMQYVLQYFQAKCQRDSNHPYLPLYLAGNVLHIRRHPRDDLPGKEQVWEAVWLNHRSILEEGVLVSRHQASDHSVARLRKVLVEGFAT